MKIKTIICGALLLVSQITLAAGAAGPDVELLCPCTFESNSSTSITVTVGITNISSNPPGELLLRAYAHAESTYSESESPLSLADISISSSTEENTDTGIVSYTTGLRQPDAGSYYVTFLLLEDGFIIDEVRMSDPIEFGRVAGISFAGDLYFDRDPGIDISGATLTIDLPAIGNSGSQSLDVTVVVAATESVDVGEFFTVAEYDFAAVIPVGGLSPADTPEYTFNPLQGFDFYHLFVIDNNSGDLALVHTVEAPGVDFDDQVFSAAGQDFLIDADGDGVADENEKLMGTDPTDGTSAPGVSYIDLLAVYPPEVTDFYDGDISARLDHLLAVSNQALSDSNVKIILRLAAAEELDIDTSQGISAQFDAAINGTGVFQNLQQMRSDAGADLIVMFRLTSVSGVCGLGTLGGYARQGAVDRSSHISVNAIRFDECGDITMIHEIGHNMGLNHSFKQGDTGSFNWSRGHGANSRFATIMAYADEFNVFEEVPYFSNPNVSLCDDLPCGVDTDQPEAAFAAKSLDAVRFQVANFTASVSPDSDSDGVPDSFDEFPDDAVESVDTDSDGMGNNADYDDDNDGMPDAYEIARNLDPLVDDRAEDLDGNGITNLEEYTAIPKATQFLQTNSSSANITSVHIINSADVSQAFTGTLYNGAGIRLGPADQSLGDSVGASERLILSSEDLEATFGIATWSGPAMLEVSGTEGFELMARLISPSGLISNTNCVRTDRVLNIDGFDSENTTFIRLINTTNDTFGEIRGTLYDSSGQVIGTPEVKLLDGLAPKQQVWINRDNLATLAGAEWNAEAMLEVDSIEGLKLLNVNFVNAETFFNFSCFESNAPGAIYLQTTSSSANESSSHIVNTDNIAQQFLGTLYNNSGEQLGPANQALHAGEIAPKGRVVLTSEDIEAAFSVAPWSGPAVLEVAGNGAYELMTKLKSPSGLTSNTNCVRRNQVHNIEGFDSSDMTFVRFINIGSGTLTDVMGSMFDSNGDAIGSSDQTLLATLPPKSSIWLNRNNLADIFDDTWNGQAMLRVTAAEDLRLINLNLVNNETFFNFSCYESAP
jgi:hypothetical protein